jgi:hypothetical protein
VSRCYPAHSNTAEPSFHRGVPAPPAKACRVCNASALPRVPIDDASAAALNAARLFQFKGEFEQLGVECLSDFNLIRPRDLERMKMNVIHKRRFVAAFRSGGGDACLAADPHSLRDDSALSESVSYPSASCQRNPVAAFPVDTPEELVVTRTQLAGSPSGGNDCAIDEEDDEEYSFCGGGSDEVDDINDVKAIPAKKSRGQCGSKRRYRRRRVALGD